MRLWVTIVLAALVGCGEDPRTLTREDVTGIPAGDAVGTLFAGQYLIASNKIDGCNCRVGSCGSLVGLTGIPTQVSQTGGALEMRVSTSTAVAEGGVNADGRYRLGSALEDPDNIQYALVQGQFTLAGGIPTRMIGSQEVTVHSLLYDCDVRSNFVATYDGAVTALQRGPEKALGVAGITEGATR